jgi:hypothetical protein
MRRKFDDHSLRDGINDTEHLAGADQLRGRVNPHGRNWGSAAQDQSPCTNTYVRWQE